MHELGRASVTPAIEPGGLEDAVVAHVMSGKARHEKKR
jgi:hypothetical protein